MAIAAPTAPGRAHDLRATRAWWRDAHPPRSIGQRLEAAYTAAITGATFGAMAYGTARSALSQVITPHAMTVFGPSFGLVGLLLIAGWGLYQGPVVFTVPDVGFLLGAPLPRRALAARRLALTITAGAVGGAVVAGFVLVSLGGDGRTLKASNGAGLAVGLAELASIGVAGAWLVERSSRAEHVVRRAIWPIGLLAAGVAATASSSGVVRSGGLWSGPWGWAVQPQAGTNASQWVAALLLLSVVTAVAVTAALLSAGDATTERHLRRAEARASAVASLMSLDPRTARQALSAAGGRRRERVAPRADRLRSAVARHGRGTGPLAIVWRDLLAALRTPGRAVEGAALAAAGTALGLLQGDKYLAVAAAILVTYVAAARLLWPLRAEFDVPNRPKVLLRPRPGLVVFGHTPLPTLITTSAALASALGCAITGALPAHGAAAAVATTAATPMITGCAAASARRGGRLPQSLLFAAIATDPTGGGGVLSAWFAAWPAAALILAGVPLLLIAAGPPATQILAAAWIAGGTVLLARLLRRDLRET